MCTHVNFDTGGSMDYTLESIEKSPHAGLLMPVLQPISLPSEKHRASHLLNSCRQELNPTLSCLHNTVTQSLLICLPQHPEFTYMLKNISRTLPPLWILILFYSFSLLIKCLRAWSTDTAYISSFTHSYHPQHFTEIIFLMFPRDFIFIKSNAFFTSPPPLPLWSFILRTTFSLFKLSPLWASYDSFSLLPFYYLYFTFFLCFWLQFLQLS